MDKEKLIESLNWFYTLELNQVEIYEAQSKNFKDDYGGMVFERVSQVEQEHVENISLKIYSRNE